MVYGVFSQAERGQSEKGLADTLEKAGLKVDRLEVTQEVNSDPTLAVPVLTAYIQAHPNLKAIGSQHGGITGELAEVLKKAGKKPGDIIVGGIDLAPATIDGLKYGYVQRHARPAALPAGIPARSCSASSRQSTRCPAFGEHRRRRRSRPRRSTHFVPLIDAGIR